MRRNKETLEAGPDHSQQILIPLGRKRKNSDPILQDWIFENGFPLYKGVLVLILYGIIFTAVFYIDGRLPSDSKEYERFNKTNAIRYMQDLVAIGPRVVGTEENEVVAVNLLKKEINSIIHDRPHVEFDHQIVSGSYFVGFKPYGSINAYQDVSNLVVKVHGNTNHSILINSHYDTVPDSYGGSDDGAMVAVMLELLRILSDPKVKLKHNLVFLFNGAEESVLQASHGFITQHKWRHGIKLVVNLEAAGVGGKELLFQAGPNQPWLLKYFSRVPYPHGQAIGEEIFEANLIPSDTDFRVFRDFGNVIGYDFAYTRNGHRYHTKYDDADIEDNVFLHTGRNMLTLVELLGNAEELDKPLEESSKPVYFDFLGLYLVRYSLTVATCMNVVVVILSVITSIYGIKKLQVGRNGWLYLFIAVFSVLIGMMLAVMFVVFVGCVLDYYNHTMRWYSNTWLILGLYCIPVITVQCLTFLLMKKYRKNDNTPIEKAELLIHINKLLYTALLFVATIFRVRSAYTIFPHVLIATATFVLKWIFHKLQIGFNWKVVYCIGSILPTMFGIQLSLDVSLLFTALTGRSGGTVNPEWTIAVLCAATTILCTSFLVPFIVALKKAKFIIYFFLLTFFVSVCLVATPFTFPYSKELKRPQRYTIFYHHRTIRSNENAIIYEDNGFTFINQDRNSPLTVMDKIQGLQSAGEVCKDVPLCGLPSLTSRNVKPGFVGSSVWKSTASSPTNYPAVVFRKDIERLSPTEVNYKFHIQGPDHMSVYVSPTNQSRVLSFDSVDMLPDQQMWQNRPVYYVLFASGRRQNASLTFSMSFLTDENSTESVADIAVVGKYVHNVTVNNEYREFLLHFPDWTAVNAWSSSYEHWVLYRT